MQLLGEVIVTALLMIGGIFGFVGSFGLVKLPDQMTRLHAPTMSVTLGVVGVLLASIAWFGFFSEAASWHELLIVLFLFMTAPITGLMIAKAHMHMNWRPDELPASDSDKNWATYGDSAERSLVDQRKETNEPRQDLRE